MTFEVERCQAVGDGRVEVSGRWFGVRGRRFVRPTLTVTMSADGPEQRWLAELEHKPWAAEDGEPWLAAFATDVDLDEAATIELSVAPDIEVALRTTGEAGGAGEAGDAGAPASRARTPRAKAPSSTRRPSARAQDLERMRTRLQAAEAALERERERRSQVEEALERHRTESRTVSAELGRAKAELELAGTVQREAAAMAAELEATRRELRAVTQRHQQLTVEHDRSVDTHRQVQTELRERTGALESARDALERERSRGAEAIEHERRRRVEALDQERTRSAERLERARAQAAGPATESYTVPGMEDGRSDSPAPGVELGSLGFGRSEPDHRVDRVDRVDRVAEARQRAAHAHRSERPVNPALASRPNWAWRVAAVVVIALVVFVVIVILNSTIF